MFDGIFTGIEVRQFQGHPGITEVECSGKHLPPDTDITSMKLFRSKDDKMLGTLFSLRSSCQTFSYFSLCHINSVQTRFSVVRSLVTEFNKDGETGIACNVSTLSNEGQARMIHWFISVRRGRKSNGLLFTVSCFCPRKCLNSCYDSRVSFSPYI